MARPARLPGDVRLDRTYNYPHFRPRHVLADALRSIRLQGIRPGERAPDFALETVDGGTLRLSDLRGTPVLLRFGSFT